MLRQRLSYKPTNGYDETPKRQHWYKRAASEDIAINERKIAAAALIFSMLVITAKLYYLYGDYWKKLLIEERLVSYKTITEDGEVFVRHAWKSAVKYSNIWLPILCGLISTYFTWCMVYLDSSVPGVQPPSPLSPDKYKQRSGHTFHINYVFSILIGVSVSAYMYWKGVSIEYDS